MISDGGSNSGKLLKSQVLKRLLDANVPILALMVHDLPTTPEEIDGVQGLLDLASESGGISIADSPVEANALAADARQLISQLPHQYELEVETLQVKKPGRLKLGVSLPGSARKARLFYRPYLQTCPAIP